MRSVFLLSLVVLGLPTISLSQTNSSDSQTLQALLAEVRELRQDLHTSLARVQSAQILLSRLQTQQAAVMHASARLDEARSTLSGMQTDHKLKAARVKQLEDTLSAEENLMQQKTIQDALNHARTDLEVTAEREQQQQTAEIQAEQMLRNEQDNSLPSKPNWTS